MNIKELPAPVVMKIAEDHIKRYEKRLAVADTNPMVRVGECQWYLALWRNVKEKGGQNLNQDELSELSDAVYEGSYDELIRQGSN